MLRSCGVWWGNVSKVGYDASRGLVAAAIHVQGTPCEERASQTLMGARYRANKGSFETNCCCRYRRGAERGGKRQDQGFRITQLPAAVGLS